LLIESLPLGASVKEWAAFESAVLGGSATCPPTVSLIELSHGLLSGKVAEEVEKHLAGCRYCAACYRGLTQAREGRQAAALEAMSDLLAEPWEDFPTSQPLTPTSAAPADSPVREFSGSLFTTFLRAAGPRDLLEKLRPALSEVLADVGLASGLADDFRQFVSRELEKRPQFASAGLSGWLEEFAREKLGLGALPRRMGPEDWYEVFVRCVLWRFPDGQDDVARVYAAARNAGMRSWKVDEQGLKKLAAEARVTDVALRQLLKKGRRSTEELARRLGPLAKA
jgi:hypothetical protein